MSKKFFFVYFVFLISRPKLKPKLKKLDNILSFEFNVKTLTQKVFEFEFYSKTQTDSTQNFDLEFCVGFQEL